MNKRLIAGAALVSAAIFSSNGALAQDAEEGAKIFRRCAACHSVEEGANRVGPSLYGVVGRKVASAENYRYSPAMQEFGADGKVWTEELLDKYLTAPQEVVPKTRMIFPGLPNAEDRANLIAYLKSDDDD